MKIIDLSSEIYVGMPMHHTQPSVKIETYATHEQWSGEARSTDGGTPSVNLLQISEHTGSHVDAISHMGKDYKDQSIDTMPLSMFFTRGICLDLSEKGLNELIEISDLESALINSGNSIQAGDTVLLYTDHYRRHFDTPKWPQNPGLSAEAATWLGQQKISAFGVESMAPGVSKISNKQVHQICGELGFTHYENLINLHELIGKGPFRFIGLPLKIRGGTGSPVRAVAVFE
ncbi:MAG: cyclase family protein [Bacteroidota bacterium]